MKKTNNYKDYKVKIKDFDNKSRKGQYLYIKKGNHPGRYYKYALEVPVDNYVNRYTANILSRIATPGKKIKHEVLSRKKVYIEKSIKSGVTKVLIPEIRNISNNELNKYKEKLLKKLVKDKELLKIIATEHNFEKIKHRIEHKIIIQQDKNTLVTCSTFNKSPEKLKSEIERNIKNGELVDNKGYNSTIKRKLELLQYQNISLQKDGNINKVSIEMKFRKA